jgi:lysophospholipase L1-like esterase
MNSEDNYRGSLEKANIVMLGNSITYQGDWKKVLNRNDIYNGGQPGWTSEQLSWVIKDFIIPYKPKLCFFTAGINDLTLGIPTQRIIDNMKMVIDSIKNVGTIPIYQTTLYQRFNFARNREIDKINSAMAEYCLSKEYDFVDLRTSLCKDGDILDKYVTEDNTHLTKAAYPVWAEVISKTIKKYNL